MAAGRVGWEYFDGGIGSHHLFARDDLPSVSNAWALLVVPTLAWFGSARLLGRSTFSDGVRVDWRALIGGGVALAYGAVLSVGFESGIEALTSVLFFGLLGLGAVFPLYRAELALGFVIGMMITFGAVLPTLFCAVFALVSLCLHPLARRLVRAVRRTPVAA